MSEIDGAITIDFGGEELELLPDRAVWWAARRTLLVADLHLGKAAAFRTLGVPVPSGSIVKDLQRIDQLIEVTSAQRLVVLGDLMHAKAAWNSDLIEVVREWRHSRRDISVLVIRGNHDRASGHAPQEWEMIQVNEPLRECGIGLRHTPPCESENDEPTLAGHVHPVTAVQDYDRSWVNMQCFVVDPRCIILPSFGTFTGGYKMMPQNHREIFVTTGTRVVRATWE